MPRPPRPRQPTFAATNAPRLPLRGRRRRHKPMVVSDQKLLRKFGVVDLWLETHTWHDPIPCKLEGRQVYRTPKGNKVAQKGEGRRNRRPGLIQFIVKHGIEPRLRTKTSTICSIGFSSTEQKWYGWSHRAMVGFGKGDRIFEDRYGTDKTPFKKHGRKAIRNMAHARVAACRFADSVS